MRARILALSLVTALAVVGCADATMPIEDGSSTPSRVVALHLNTRTLNVTVGEPVQLTAAYETADGWRVPTSAVEWRVSDPTIAVVENGLVVPLRSGETQVTAVYQGVMASAAVKTFGSVSATGLTIVPETLTVAVNAKAMLTGELEYSNGRKASIRNSAEWKSLDPTIAKVNRGQVTGLKDGVARVVATMSGESDTSTVLVGSAGTTTPPPSDTTTTPPPPSDTATTPPPPAPTPSTGDVSVALRRFDGGSGTVLVSNGVPLKPGMLFPGQERQVRLFVGGTEQKIAAWSLPSTHRDGSLRMVMVQALVSVPSGGASGTITLGTARATSMDLAKQAVAPLPAAAVLPTDPEYLIATDFVGPTVTSAEAKLLGTTVARYENDFVTFADEHWVETADERGGNYYDRALIYYAFWARTGNPEYWYRGNRMAYRYRVDYLEYNNYGASAHWSQLEGVQLHYLFTADEQSRKAVGATADMLYRSVHTRNGFGDPTTQQGENRQLARMLQAELLAWRINATGNYVGTAWASKLDDALNGILRLQSADGAFRFPDLCGQGLNYMDGMLADVLIEYHRVYRADSRILPALQRLASFQWASQWLTDARAFQYAYGYCEGVGGTSAALDVLGLEINLYAWVYAQTGQTLFRDRADAIFNAMVGRVWLDGTKQFNQQYTTSYRYLAYRR